MKLVLQRVSEARVEVGGEVIGEIGQGLLVFVGLGKGDSEELFSGMAKKVVNLRIFEDEAGKMNRSLLDVGGEILLVSQFTLYADTRRGRRPSFVEAMGPEEARELFAKFVEEVKQYPVKVEQGQFQAQMEVFLCNDGPVTILLES